MKFYSRIIDLVVILTILFTTAVVYANPSSDIHITPDGKFSATNVVVMQKAGTSNFFGRVTWGNTFVRVTILAHDNTSITKDHGEKGTADDIREGDILNVEGTLSSSDGALIIDATRIRDSSLQVESKNFSGNVKSVDPSQLSLTLTDKISNEVTIITATSTSIQKGVRTITFGDISVGDKILSVTGSYNYLNNILTASNIAIYQDKKIFTERNFQGTLKSISGTTLPVAFTVVMDGTDYTVYLSTNASVLSKNRSVASLTRFVIGDTIRFYGAIRQTNLNEIDAIILRDLNF